MLNNLFQEKKYDKQTMIMCMAKIDLLTGRSAMARFAPPPDPPLTPAAKFISRWLTIITVADGIVSTVSGAGNANDGWF